MSATRATWPSMVLARCSGGAPTGMPCLPFECRAMPSRTSHVRFRPCAIVLEHVDDAQALLVVIEAAGHQAAEHALAGVAERRVAEVVAERDRLGQLLVQAQHLGDRARDLRDFERVRQPRAVMIAGRREEHLRLVLQAAERLGVDDAVAIALERRPDRRPPASLRTRPLLSALFEACGARISRSRCSSCSRMDAIARSDHAHRDARTRSCDHVLAGSSCRAPAAPTPKFSASVCPRSANVVARADVDAGAHPLARQQQRHVLARVIGARRRRIVAVIGGDHEQIVAAQLRQQARRGARRSARGSPRTRRRRCDGRRACRSRRGWRR